METNFTSQASEYGAYKDFNDLLSHTFAGQVVNKSIVKEFKNTLNVPSYVIEYLVGSYCATTDPDELEAGKDYIRDILSNHFVRPNTSEHVKMLIKETGSYKIIDKISAYYHEKLNVYLARFENFDASKLIIEPEYVTKYDKLTLGGIWAVIQIDFRDFGQSSGDDVWLSPFEITSITPIQLASFDIDKFIANRSAFTSDEWKDLLLKSIGYNPDSLNNKEKLHCLERIVPLIEHNYNLCELGYRGTGKSYVYKEISPYSILMTGGETTVANMFYNMVRHQAGLIAKWDCVAFDEVAGLPSSKADLAQGLKDYMESGSIARGQASVQGEASIVLIGNTNASPDTMQMSGHLFTPFPKNLRNDAAFFDRIHYYIPGWETPKLDIKLLTGDCALSADIIAEFCRHMRPREMDDLIDQYFVLNSSHKVRDTKSVRKTFSGLAKLLYPDGAITKDEAKELLEYAIEGRRRVKEQLYRMVPDEYRDFKLGYLDITDNSEHIVTCNYNQ